MTTDKCPFCGAELHGTFNIESPFPFDNYKCGTNKWDKDTIRQSTKCKDRQIAQLQEKLEVWREYAKHLAMMVPKAYRVKLTGYQNLKDLGEI